MRPQARPPTATAAPLLSALGWFAVLSGQNLLPFADDILTPADIRQYRQQYPALVADLRQWRAEHGPGLATIRAWAEHAGVTLKD